MSMYILTHIHASGYCRYINQWQLDGSCSNITVNHGNCRNDNEMERDLMNSCFSNGVNVLIHILIHIQY